MFTDRELELLFRKMEKMLEPLQAKIKELQKDVEDLTNEQQRFPTKARGRKRVQQTEENAGASH
jgi:uncharacterized protein YlxW (UPF0749 family)